MDLKIRGEGMEVNFVSDFGTDEEGTGGAGGFEKVDVKIGGEGINIKVRCIPCPFTTMPTS